MTPRRCRRSVTGWDRASHHQRVRAALACLLAAAVGGDRSGWRLLVGVLDAPGRGLPHHRVGRPPPRHARGFFEALIADNLDLGRPANVEIIFGRKIRSDTKGVFRTAIDRRDNQGVVVNVFYKHSRIKQYLKDGRAMRIETVVNAPRDLGCNARLPNLDDLQAKARACNRRILDAQACRPGLCACESRL